MSTTTITVQPTASLVTALRHSWLVSALEAVAAAFQVLLLGDAALDPEIGVRR